MADTLWAEYGQPLTVDFVLWETDGTDLQTGAVHAAGDTTIVLDEAAAVNTTNGFVDEGLGYSILLPAAQLQAARAVLYIVDQTAPKAWLDKTIRILTHSHPLAHDPRGVIAAGTAQAGAGTSITLASGESALDDFFVGDVIEISGGTGAGQSRVITDYVGSTKVAAVDPNWVITPDATSVYRIYTVPPSAGLDAAVVAGLTTFDAATAADAEGVLDALLTDTYAVPGQGGPPTTPTMIQALLYVFKLGVHAVEQTSSEFRLMNRAGNAVEQKAATTEAGGTFTRASLETGP